MSAVWGEWLDGQPVTDEAGAPPADPARWAHLSAAMLGCGFRVHLTRASRAAERDHALAQVEQIAALLSVKVDQAPWEAVRDLDAAVVIEGGWAPVFRGPLGAPRTRVAVAAPPPGVPTTSLIELPWSVSGASPTAALPMLTDTTAALAATHVGSLAGSGEVAGLWRTSAGVASHSTHGALLLRGTEGGWRHPDSPTFARTWLWEQVVEALESRPLADGEVTQMGRWTAVAVAPWGTLTHLIPAPESDESASDSPEPSSAPEGGTASHALAEITSALQQVLG